MKKISWKVSYLIISTLLICCPIRTFSQWWVEGGDEILNRLRIDKNISSMEKVTYSSFEGDPFLYKNFAEGKVTMKNNETYQLKMRYDIYADQVQFIRDDKVYNFISPGNISSLTIDTLRFIYSDFKNSPDDKDTKGSSFFILKKDGKCKLLVKKNIRIQAAEPPKIYQDAKPPKFIITADTYFFKIGDESAVRVRSKKDVLNLLGNRSDDIAKFISTNKLGTNISDLYKIAGYYNGLKP